MKIKKFLLYDNGTKDKLTFMDLIILDKECEPKTIFDAIQKLKNEDIEANGFYTYTNEDIYNVIRETCGDFTIYFLGDLDEFEY